MNDTNRKYLKRKAYVNLIVALEISFKIKIRVNYSKNLFGFIIEPVYNKKNTRNDAIHLSKQFIS